MLGNTPERFFTMVGCIDGRCQQPIITFGQERFDALYPDSITDAGLVGMLTKTPKNKTFIDSLRYKIHDISIQLHHSVGIIVYGHEQCAGNPVPEEQHLRDIRNTSDCIKTFVATSLPVIPIFVRRNDGIWTVEEI